MKKLYLFSGDEKYIEKCKKFFNYFEINIIDKKAIMENVDIETSNILYNDYVKLYFIYNNPGLLLDGNFSFGSSMNTLFENDAFLGFDTENTVSTNVIWAKNVNNKYIKNILDVIKENKFDNITKAISKAINRDLSNTYNSLVNIDKKLYIYPYDYFFPIDYEKHGKRFSENTKLIYHKNVELSKKQKLKLNTFEKYGGAASSYYNSLIESLRQKGGAKKYKMMQKLGIDSNKDDLEKAVYETLEVLEGYKKKNVDYIIFHNPRWMGVTSATKELFENLVPLQELPKSSYTDMIVQKISEIKPKQVIFSAFADGWESLARKIKRNNKDILLKSFWHGSHSQVIEDINWRTNLAVINLHKDGIIDVMGTCKESLLNFYVAQGYKAAFIKNTVRLSDELYSLIQEHKKEYEAKRIEEKDSALKIGMYAAGLGWRKNMFTQIAAASLFDNAVIDSVPLSFESQVFTSKFGNVINGISKGVKREELLKRLACNDINLYVTFSECAPMLPIESMEVGTICISGNNHHYFKDTELERYLVVDREDDVIAIKDKIKYALENKEEIFRLYKEWKNNYDLESKKSVEEFLSM